ncbi:hypothetical protein N310_13370, partial [Acanthisitta chloris]
IYIPRAAAGHNYNNLKELACWSINQFKLTSQMVAELMTDVDSIRHAVLQNQAAIDFLLLAQRHGCEESEGMCCMNLFDHSVSIHKQLKQLQDNANEITARHNPFDDWLQSLGLT